MERIEQTTLKNLIHNDEYARKVLPFLKEEYFTKDILKKIDEIACRKEFRYGDVVEIPQETQDDQS